MSDSIRMTHQVPPGDRERMVHQLMREGRLGQALPLAQAVAQEATRCTQIHGMLAMILHGLFRPEEAEQAVARALQLPGGIADAYDALAFVSIMLGSPERANALYRRAMELQPRDARFCYNFASSERSLGRLASAEGACNRAIALDRTHFASYLLRSELRMQTADANHVAELLSRVGELHSSDRAVTTLGYALGKEFDDMARYEEAFHWYSNGAAARRRQLSYDVAVDERKLQRVRECFGAWQADPAPDDESSRHIFIVGLPRSGTTLLERILTRLSGVRTNGETENFSRALLAAAPSGDGDVFLRAAQASWSAVAESYSKMAGAAKPGVIVEKLPMNYLYLGAIHRALPNAKILWMTRSPLDSCFAMFRTLFGQAYPFSYDFSDLARYYVAYHRLMTHWRSVLGSSLYEVRYQDLVTDTATVGAAVAAHCGLVWQDSAIQVENNALASFTASASQIRRPIYSSSVERWRHYRKYLDPLWQRLVAHGLDPER